MPAPLRRSPLVRTLGALAATILLASCTEGPVAESGTERGALRIPSAFSLKGAVAGTAQADALDAAFDQVNRFRLVIRRVGSPEVVADVVIEVEPGEDTYSLSAPVPAVLPGEEFEVTIIAMAGDVVLFESAPIRVTSVPEDSPDVGELPQIELEYTGPGADAASISVAPGSVVLAPGGASTLTATVRTSGGAVLAGVPLAWSTGSPAVANVTGAGSLTGVASGATQFTATTPTGLSASGWAYVVSGEIAFAQGGRVRTRAVAGGAASDVGAGGSPSYFPAPSGRLVWSSGGRVLVDGGEVADGGWPAVSPDGTKLAVERGGRVWFTNLNGSNATSGPLGTAPAWMPGGAFLAVGGGSIQRVRADGTERSTMVAGTAALPALGPSGRLAFTAGSELVVQGGGTVASDVSGRAAWSPAGDWLVVSSGGELVLVDPAGVAPPVSLGLPGASDPAWRGAMPAVAPASPSLRALEPDPAVPGGEVRLQGAGFDWIIPSNTRVLFPGADGPLAGEVRDVEPGTITALMPAATVAGSIRVITPQGEASIGFEPRSGAIHVRARSGDTPVPGAHVIVRQGSATIAADSTNAEGRAAFDLPPGDYSVGITAPAGWRLSSANPVPVRLGFAVSEVSFAFIGVPARVTIEPAAPVVAMGTPLSVRARAYDAAGTEITEFITISWAGSTEVEATGSTMTGRLTGIEASETPGDAGFAVILNGQRFRFDATVTAAIEGTVGTYAEEVPQLQAALGEGIDPVEGVTVILREDGEIVARATTNARGIYRFTGLLAGRYRITVDAPVTSPTERIVTLTTNVRDQDFVLAEGGGPGSIRGRVRNPEGVGVEGITVVAIPYEGCGEYALECCVECGLKALGAHASVTADAEGPPAEVPLLTAVTDAEGRYRFDGLELGDYVFGPVALEGPSFVSDPEYRTVTLTEEEPIATGQNFRIDVPEGFDGSVLYFSDYVVGTDQILAGLRDLEEGGLITLTVASSRADLIAKMSTNPDILIYFNQNNCLGTQDVTALVEWVEAGKRLILADWCRNTTVFAALDASAGSVNRTSATFTDSRLAVGVQQPMPFTNPGWGTYTMGMVPLTGGVSGCTFTGYTDSCLVYGNSGRTAAVGWLNDTTTDSDGQSFIQNLLPIIASGSAPTASSSPLRALKAVEPAAAALAQPTGPNALSRR